MSLDALEKRLLAMCKPEETREPEEAMEPPPPEVCAYCGNELDGWTCRDTDCLEERERQERERYGLRRWKAATPSLYRNTDTEHPEFNLALWDKLKDWEPKEEGKGMGIYGAPGTSKTRILFLLLKKQAINGNSLAHVSGSTFARLAQNQFKEVTRQRTDALGHRLPGAEKTFEEASGIWRTRDYLLIDDLDKVPKWTDRLESDMFELLEHRANSCMPTLWSANCSLDEIVHSMTSHRGPAIMRRLREFSYPIVEAI